MFDVIKQSRLYGDYPYAGPASDGLPMRFDTLEEALAAKKQLTERNPVGWDIYNTQTREKIIVST
jgi:hypothetical protein